MRFFSLLITSRRPKLTMFSKDMTNVSEVIGIPVFKRSVNASRRISILSKRVLMSDSDMPADWLSASSAIRETPDIIDHLSFERYS